MNRYLILFTFIVSCFAAQGQTNVLKYKDVFEIAQNESESKAYEILKKYQKQNPLHANTYYQLGIIAQNWSKKFDPLTDYQNLSFFTYHANLYYNLSLKYLDEKESKKNRDYYHHVKPLDGEKKVKHNQILSDIEGKINAVKDYENKINFIRQNYYGAVRNYSNSLNSFKSIVDKNGKLKDIYLTADNKLVTDIKNIGVNFDSTVYYFDIYKDAILKFPIKSYKQDYKKLRIETYRLDGLTKSNFLKNDISLWDYKKWSDDVLSVINSDISKLRFDIKTEGAKIKSLTHLLGLTKEYNANYDYYTINKELAYRIGRYDFQPLILDIFNYQASKLNLIIGSKKPINNPANIGDSATTFHSKLLFYKTLVDKKQTTDNKLNILKKRIIPFNILKYNEYITANFDSPKGLTNYTLHEPDNIKAIFGTSLDNLKKNVLFEKQSVLLNLDVIKYKNKNISLSLLKTPLTGSKNNHYYTTSIATNNKGHKYFTGYYNTEGKNTKAFIAKCDNQLNIKWYKVFDLSKSRKKPIDNYGCQIALTDNGCILIINTRDTANGNAIIKNWVISFNESGKQISKKPIGPNLIPRQFIYDDINEKIIAAFKGTSLNENEVGLDTLIVEYADSIGRKIWDAPILFNGNLINIIRSNEKLIVIANFSELKYNNKQIFPKNNGTNALMGIIDKNGSVLDVKTYLMPYTYYLTHAIKLNSETINLLGIKSNKTSIHKIKNNTDIKLFYMLLNNMGGVTYKY